MSQHYLTLTVKHHGLCQLLLGWDRPLASYHCTLRQLTNASPCRMPVLYSNFQDLVTYVHSNELDYYLDVLANRFGITLPMGLIENVYLDCLFNEGNRFVHYDQEGKSDLKPGC